MLSDRELTRRLTLFLRRLRYRVQCEYLLVNEWNGGHRHTHLLVRAQGEVTAELVSELWTKVIPGPPAIRSSYCRPVEDPIRVARYMVKHVADEGKKEMALRSYGGRVMTCSKGFLSQSNEGTMGRADPGMEHAPLSRLPL
jgi:hypothetical protein